MYNNDGTQMTQMLRNADLRRFFSVNYKFSQKFNDIEENCKIVKNPAKICVAEGICVICVPFHLGTARYRIMPMKVKTILGNQTANNGGIPPDWAIPLLIIKNSMYKNANINPKAI
jgi:hypothetical protein